MKFNVVTFLIPFALALLELFHPYEFGGDVYVNLQPLIVRWISVHLFQLFLFPGMAIVLFSLVRGIHGGLASFAKVFIFLFAIFYTAFDSVVGLGLGSLLRIGFDIPADQQEAMENIVQRFYFDPLFGGSHSWLSETASFTALLSVWSVALVLWKRLEFKWPLLLYFFAAPILWYSHAYPYGPIAFLFIGLANLWLFFDEKTRKPQPS